MKARKACSASSSAILRCQHMLHLFFLSIGFFSVPYSWSTGKQKEPERTECFVAFEGPKIALHTLTHTHVHTQGLLFNWKAKYWEHITWMDRWEKGEEKLREHNVVVRERVGHRAKRTGHQMNGGVSVCPNARFCISVLPGNRRTCFPGNWREERAWGWMCYWDVLYKDQQIQPWWLHGQFIQWITLISLRTCQICVKDNKQP